jgi:hypothetical protein
MAKDRRECAMTRSWVVAAAAAGAMLAIGGPGAAQATEASPAGQAPDAAYVEAYAYACHPVEQDAADRIEPLSDAAQRIHDGLLMVTYGGSCHDFYYTEVVPRLDPEQRPFFLAPFP